MSQLKIYNTLSRTIEPFQPRNKQQPKDVGLYVCGMTVYDYCHIGNARVFIFFDLVARYLRLLGYNVNYVRNITDIDDKIIKRANELKIDSGALAQRYADALQQDLQQLGLLTPTHEPRVTEHLPEIIAIIQTLISKGYAYVGSNGDVYFETSKFKKYGELAHQDLENLRVGARVDVNEAKRSALDFVLWKMAKPSEPAWPSPWGAGRPGWHIECSAMARRYLGDHFDIHGGGADLQFPHHQNELAQSEAACGCQESDGNNGNCNFVKYWMHVGFVSVEHAKMSKSLGNFFSIRAILKHYHPEVVRLFLLTAHYRSPLNYADTLLDAAHESLTTLYTAIRGLNLLNANQQQSINDTSAKAQALITQLTSLTEASTDDTANEANEAVSDLAHTPSFTAVRQAWQGFINALNDDFNVPLALSHIFAVARLINKAREQTSNANSALAELEIMVLAAILRDRMCAILGVLQCNAEQFFQDGIDNQTEIQELIDARLAARKNKEWQKADQIREQLDAMGIILEDNASGTTWKKRH
jgi:cysteinyl-tRNA synthetase